MAFYTVRYGETLLDVCYNTTGAITAIDAIMDANGFDTYTPELTPGQVLEVPDVVYNSDAVHVANVRPFNSACGIEDDDLYGMIDGAVSDMGDIPGPPDDPSLDPVEPEPDKRFNTISPHIRYAGNNIYMSVESTYPVESRIKVDVWIYVSEKEGAWAYLFIDKGETSSSETTIYRKSSDSKGIPTLATVNKITPPYDDTYQCIPGPSVPIHKPTGINYIQIKYRLPESKNYITIFTVADFPVASDIKCTMELYSPDDPDVPSVQVTTTNKKDFQSSSEVSVQYSGQTRCQFIINGIIPVKDDTYSYQAGNPIEIIP